MKGLKKLVTLGLVLALTTGQADIYTVGDYIANAKEIPGEAQMVNTFASISEKSKVDLEVINAIIKGKLGNYREVATKADVATNKSWLVTFNKDVDHSKISKSNIKVINKDGLEIDVAIEKGNTAREVVVKAPVNGYAAAGTYALMLIKDTNNIAISEGTAMKFVIKSNSTVEIPSKVVSEQDVYGDVQKAHELYLRYVAGTRHDKSNFTIAELMTSPYKSFEEYAEEGLAFNKLYMGNPQYANVTDLDYYKQIKGLTINFDKVNNSNKAPLGSMVDHVPLKVANLKQEEDKYSRYYNADNPYLTSIWRVDTAKEIVDAINKTRESKGMKTLQLDADLTAISMWGAKRSFMNGVRSESLPTDSISDLEGAVPWGANMSVNPAYQEYITERQTAEQDDIMSDNNYKFGWVRRTIINGTTPLVAKSTENFTPGYSRAEDVVLYNTNIEKDLTQYFDYSKPIRLINYATTFDYTGEKIVKRLSDRESIGLPSSHPYSMGKHFINKNFNNEIYRDDITNIGVGVMYEKPFNSEMYNGVFVVYIIVS